jgi:hypothetical protein
MAKEDAHQTKDHTEPPKDDIQLANGTKNKSPTSFARRKYNHLFAIHSQPKVTILSSSDAEKAPNFVGFRNLMVLMLCEASIALNPIENRS